MNVSRIDDLIFSVDLQLPNSPIRYTGSIEELALDVILSRRIRHVREEGGLLLSNREVNTQTSSQRVVDLI